MNTNKISLWKQISVAQLEAILLNSITLEQYVIQFMKIISFK